MSIKIIGVRTRAEEAANAALVLSLKLPQPVNIE